MNKPEEKKKREPLFQIEKRDRATLMWKKMLLIRGGSIFAAIITCGILSAILLKANPFEFFGQILDGAFKTEQRVWILLRNTALLLGVALAIVPAFKMKFWNLGANGQVLIACLMSTICMYYLGDKINKGLLIVIMFLVSVLSGAIWAVIPAIFKAIWKTNESLFTLMMNYIAQGLVVYFLNVAINSNTGVLDPLEKAKVPELANEYLLPILVVAIMTAFIFVYMKYSKHGYEISVVGESENTARYIGINVKKVVIRTLVISGLLCGIMGFLLSGAIHGTVNKDIVENRGFTAIMVAWLAKFNPLIMILTSFFITFVDRGVQQAGRFYGLTNEALPNIMTAIIFFFIIGCEFFIEYKIKIRLKKKEEEEKVAQTETIVADTELDQENASPTVDSEETKQEVTE